MTLPEILMLVMATVVGFAGLFRNATAVALAAQYALIQGAFWRYGVVFDTRIQLLTDLTVIALIYCKPPLCQCLDVATLARLKVLWLERGFWDRVVLACFPFMWLAYGAPDYERWWLLWTLSMAQFAAAGIDACQQFNIARSAKAGSEKPKNIGKLEFATGRGLGYG